jgi:predicted metal-dependent peptidase
MQRLVSELVRVKTDWRAVLRRYMTEKVKTDLTYARPKRRFLAQGLYLPSLTGEGLGEVVFAVDCSGSVDEAMLKLVTSEMLAITSDTKPKTKHVVYFDSQVLRHDTFDKDTAIETNHCGGGGTAFSPIFRHIQEQGITPACVIVLTDLQCYDYGDDPGYPVLWACTTAHDKVPFGDVVRIEE